MECLREQFYDGVVLDGRFKTISPLNHGSFGMVFMAKDLQTEELVAVKCLTKRSANPEGTNSSFAVDDKSEELACHARLGQHANIVNLVHSFETDAHIYLVLEFCSRGDLYEAIRTGCGPLETEHVREFMLQLVDAVAYIHARGMYHRDIKPENIFLTKDGTLKLGDLGLATKDVWSYETAVGSDRYMSPEQYDSNGSGYSPAQADVWAIGICLLNILFSRNPFTTPTESDPLFLDFSRDKQSLFDVFPNMSQDTFEVITSCMSLDPLKRSLSNVREALLRAVSFTTFDETLDDFSNVSTRNIVSANREPLRTPSVQSPQVDQTSFPWAKALHASPQVQSRQLSIIHDDESYSEDLFSHDEESHKDWFSVGAQTPSLASVLTSSLGASMHSLAIRRAVDRSLTPRPNVTPISGSLPISMIKPKPLPSMASIFGRKHDQVSKSWSDLVDEDLEEEEHERELRERQAKNARTWSHESVKENLTTDLDLDNTPVAKEIVNDIDTSEHVNDGFFFQDTTPRQLSPPRYSPPSKRTTFDKWAALGARRRAFTGSSDSEKSPGLWRGRRNTGNQQSIGFNSFGPGLWENKANKETRSKECPWVRDFPRKEKAPSGDFGEMEWVGGWHDDF